MVNFDPLVAWIVEREAVRRRREAGKRKPWSSDKIFQQWSFCNVERERDKVTVWIRENWREPHSDDPDLFFAMVVARFVNEPDGLAQIGWPVPWDPEHFLAVMADRKARGAKCYREDAYMLRADARLSRPKPEYQVADIFNPVWRARKDLRPRTGETLASFHKRLGARHGFGGGFMTAQIVADLKYVEPLRSAADWMTFAASGPGSRPGLNRLLGRDKDAPWNEAAWRREFDRLREAIQPDLADIGLGDLHAQDLQSCLCEYAKFEHIREGGKGKRRFDGAGLGGLLEGF